MKKNNIFLILLLLFGCNVFSLDETSPKDAAKQIAAYTGYQYAISSEIVFFKKLISEINKLPEDKRKIALRNVMGSIYNANVPVVDKEKKGAFLIKNMSSISTKIDTKVLIKIMPLLDSESEEKSFEDVVDLLIEKCEFSIETYDKDKGIYIFNIRDKVEGK